MMARERWSESVGITPHKVLAYEHPYKDDVLYLRWRAGGNWKWRSLGVKLRDAKGKIRPEIRRMALSEAERQYEILSGKRATGSGPITPLTVANTWPIVADPKTGLYPVETRHVKEVARALAHAARIWGDATPWDIIDRARLRMLGRTRVDELRANGRVGYRDAELTVQRVLGVAAWLRDESRIASDACLAPRRWREDLRAYWSQVSGNASPEPAQPRHSLEEMRALIRVATEVDPRFALLVALGAELRLGQVARARRSDLSEEHRTLRIRGRGKKKGTLVELTGGQWAAWERAKVGYLARLEESCADYPLFPSGQMPGGRSGHGVADPERHGQASPIDRTAIRKWFAAAEKKAQISHVKGRGAYGLRRVAVDAVNELGISRQALMQHGGWTDTQVPDTIYADREARFAREEAARLRAKIRGEEP